MTEILALVIIGGLSGWIAQLLVLGDESVPSRLIIVIGIAGSFIGSFIYHLYVKDNEGYDGTVFSAGMAGAIISLSLHFVFYKLKKD